MDGAGGVAEGGGPASAAGSAGELEQAQAAKQQQQQQEEQKQQMLHSLLENSARERCAHPSSQRCSQRGVHL